MDRTKPRAGGWWLLVGGFFTWYKSITVGDRWGLEVAGGALVILLLQGSRGSLGRQAGPGNLGSIESLGNPGRLGRPMSLGKEVQEATMWAVSHIPATESGEQITIYNLPYSACTCVQCSAVQCSTM